MIRERAIQILKMNEQEKWRSGITAEEEKEAIDMTIKALRNMDKLEYLITTHKQKGHSPHYVVTMEELAYLLDIKEGEAE